MPNPRPDVDADAPVSLGPAAAGARWSELCVEARSAAGDPAAALEVACRWQDEVPVPGEGRTRERWEALASLGASDLTVARALEPHLDALAIRHEAGRDDDASGRTWGVWAAEGPGVRLEAREEGGQWRLSGTKPWCSLAGVVSTALVTAWVDDEHRALFEVSLDEPGVSVLPHQWVSRGLPRVVSGPVAFEAAPARAIGEPGWYLERPGFWWGGIGVAAVWFGGAVAVARRLAAQAGRRPLDQVGRLHLATVDTALWSARAVLLEASAQVDGRMDGEAGAMLAMRVRHVVAEAAERVIATTERALGPAPLTGEERYAAAIADLRVYLRQQHGERDAAGLGAMLEPS